MVPTHCPRAERDRLLPGWHEIACHRALNVPLQQRGWYPREFSAGCTCEKGFGSEADVHLTADNKLVVVQ